MLVTRRSPLTGRYTTIDIQGLTQDHLDAWQGGKLIQDAMPDVSPTDREFLISGMTPEEQDVFFKEEPEAAPEEPAQAPQ